MSIDKTHTIEDVFTTRSAWAAMLEFYGGEDDPRFHALFQAVGETVMEEQGIGDGEEAKLLPIHTQLGERSEAAYQNLLLFMLNPSNRVGSA